MDTNERQCCKDDSRGLASIRGSDGLLLKDEVFQVVGCAMEVLNELVWQTVANRVSTLFLGDAPCPEHCASNFSLPGSPHSPTELGEAAGAGVAGGCEQC